MKRRTFLLVGGSTMTALFQTDELWDTVINLSDTEGEHTVPANGQRESDSAEPGIAIRHSTFRPGNGNDPTDAGWLLIAVENIGSQRLASVDLLPETFGPDNVSRNVGFASVENLDPGEVWIARLQFPGPVQAVTDHVVRGSFTPGNTISSPETAELLRDELHANGCPTSVRGTARNTGNSDMEYLEARVKFYDASGRVVATGHDNETRVTPGERWRFEVDAPATLPRGAPISSHTLELSTAWW